MFKHASVLCRKERPSSARQAAVYTVGRKFISAAGCGGCYEIECGCTCTTYDMVHAVLCEVREESN